MFIEGFRRFKCSRDISLKEILNTAKYVIETSKLDYHNLSRKPFTNKYMPVVTSNFGFQGDNAL